VNVRLSRRALLGLAVASAGCEAAPRALTPLPPSLRLSVRPDQHTLADLPAGTSKVPLSNGRTALLHVPRHARPALVVALHGARGNASSGLDLLRPQADRLGFVLLAPASAGSTWAPIGGGADQDTPALQAALTDTLRRWPVVPQHLAVAGFSDGASYALTLGLANGDVLPRVVAFSPGFETAGRRQGRPAVFVTHGTRDEVLPVERTSRVLVRALRRDGLEVDYREFDGPHVVPRELADEAGAWLVR
jgi:phospholipase/carboxylesterase